MNRVSFIENFHYKEKKMMDILGCKEAFLYEFINEMIKRKIVIKVELEYQFKFVGLILYKDKIIFITPKYLLDSNSSLEEQNRITRLLKDYSTRENLKVEEKEFLGYDDRFNENILGIIDYILTDFFENGLYLNEEFVHEINGSGRIEWNKTIDKNNIFFDDIGNPLYLELVTSKINLNENLIITNIHKYIINQCFSQFKKLDFLDVFGYEDLSFDLDELYFDDDEFIINHLYKELNNQYQDRKVILLKAMINYVTKNGISGEESAINIYGTRYFHIVWEKITAYIFNNQYAIYKEDIPNPVWKGINAIKGREKDTLIPDILVNCEELDTLLILDAKYYNFNFDSNGVLKGRPPGMEDIVKQLAYESVFKHKFHNIFNAFIIPTVDESKLTGSVHFELFNTSGKIYTLHLNANEVINNYIIYKRYDYLPLMPKMEFKYNVDTNIDTSVQEIKVAESD